MSGMPADAAGHDGQFYGLIDDLAIFRRALTAAEIAALAAARRLTGRETGLYSGWCFDIPLPSDPALPSTLERGWTLTQPQAYVVRVSASRNSTSDVGRLQLPFSQTEMCLPFPFGQEWRVTQGYNAPAEHTTPTPPFAGTSCLLKVVRRAMTFSPALPGRVVYVNDGDAYSNNIVLVKHAPSAYGNYLHVRQGALPLGAQPRARPEWLRPFVERNQRITKVGDAEAGHGNFHLHFAVTNVPDTPSDHTRLVTIPISFTRYEASDDNDQTWYRVDRGVPRDGQLVRSAWEERTMEATWVPGYAATPEFVGSAYLANVNGVAWTDVVGLRQGFRAMFRGKANTFNWFHFAVPTPVISDGARVRLLRVFVLYDADAGAVVERVHIFDGRNRKHEYNGLALTGNHAGALDRHNSWQVPNPPEIFWASGYPRCQVHQRSQHRLHVSRCRLSK
jgi:hypothetical protein